MILYCPLLELYHSCRIHTSSVGSPTFQINIFSHLLLLVFSYADSLGFETLVMTAFHLYKEITPMKSVHGVFCGVKTWKDSCCFLFFYVFCQAVSNVLFLFVFLAHTDH